MRNMVYIFLLYVCISVETNATYSFSFEGDFVDGSLGGSRFLAELLFDDLIVDEFVADSTIEKSVYSISSLIVTHENASIDVTTSETRLEFSVGINSDGTRNSNVFRIKGSMFNFVVLSRGVFSGTNIKNLNSISGLSNPDIELLDGGGFAFSSVIDPAFRLVSPLTKISSSIPEPESWLMMIFGFTIIGFGLKYRENIVKLRKV